MMPSSYNQPRSIISLMSQVTKLLLKIVMDRMKGKIEYKHNLMMLRVNFVKEKGQEKVSRI